MQTFMDRSNSKKPGAWFKNVNSVLKNYSTLATASTPKAEEKVAIGYQRSTHTGKNHYLRAFLQLMNQL